ncbi:MAG: PilW family protein [Pseudomonadota bacterium]
MMRGFSLIELLVSMVMALLLANGVMEIYLSSTTLERDQEARARMQENGRLAIHLLTEELRLAGALGCLPTLAAANIHSTLQNTPATLQPALGIQGWEASSSAPAEQEVEVISTSATSHWRSTAGGALEETRGVPGSDILRVWYGASTGASLDAISPASVLTLRGSGVPVLAEGDVLLLSDCTQADWVQACHVQSGTPQMLVNSQNPAVCSPGNNPSSFVQSLAGGEVLRLQSSLFYIGKRGNLATNPPALFRRQLQRTAVAGVAEELVEGIASLQVRYGVDLDGSGVVGSGNVDAYVTADQVPDWRRVISVRISLLVQSLEDHLLPAPQAYRFDGVTYDGKPGNGSLPADTRLRRAFTTTVTLRARLTQESDP